MRWTGNAKNPFPAGARNAEYRGFEKVIDNSGHGLIGEVQSLKTPNGETRLVVSAWSSWPSVNRAGGVYITGPIPAHGLHAGRSAGTLHPLLTLDQFDPDPIIGPTWGGGMLSVYNGEIYWGTMTIGTAYTGAFTAANPSVGVSPASRDDIARAMFSRAAHLFKIKVSNLEHPEIELLFGNEYFPTLNKEDGTWSLKKNLLNLTPKLGKAGFGYGTNNYSWESTVYNGKLFIGTMDYSGGLVDYVENAPPHSDQQIDANYRVAKEQGFMPGGDLLVFEHPNEQPIIITRSGLDNIDNNGFRNFVTVNNTLYAGTSSEANIGPHAGYSFYVLNN